MRYAIAFALLCLCNACDPTGTDPVLPTNPDSVESAHWIPNWYNGDTLVSADGRDTMYSATAYDTSCLLINGSRYYLWSKAPAGIVGGWIDNAIGYHHCYIGPVPMDSASALAYSMQSTAGGWRYKQGAQWYYQRQMVSIGPSSIPDLQDSTSYIALSQHQ